MYSEGVGRVRHGSQSAVGKLGKTSRPQLHPEGDLGKRAKLDMASGPQPHPEGDRPGVE